MASIAKDNDFAQARINGSATMRFWNFSGGMESAAMLWICKKEIKACGGHVVFADTGKQFPEAYESLNQIQNLTGLQVDVVRADFTFDEFLLERGGMLRRGFIDCSKRMKRVPLKRFHARFEKPWEINLGFNADELDRARDFSERNDVPGEVVFRYPLLEADISRADSVEICERAGFSIVVAMYRKMGRMDCYFCPNQKIQQAQKVQQYYPNLWQEWKELEAKKGHSFLSVLAQKIEEMPTQQDFFVMLDKAKPQCACFGGSEQL